MLRNKIPRWALTLFSMPMRGDSPANPIRNRPFRETENETQSPEGSSVCPTPELSEADHLQPPRMRRHGNEKSTSDGRFGRLKLI